MEFEMKKAYPEDRFPKPAVPAPAGARRPQPESVLKTRKVVVDSGERPSTTWGVHQQEEQS